MDYEKLETYLATHPNPYESSESEDSSDDENDKKKDGFASSEESGSSVSIKNKLFSIIIFTHKIFSFLGFIKRFW